MPDNTLYERAKNAVKTAASKVLPQGENTTEEEFNLFQQLKDKMAGGWKSQFLTDIYKERILDPHQEMATARKILLYNAWAQAGVRTLVNFLFSGEVYVESENRATQQFLNSYLEDSNLEELTPQIFEDLIAFGNFYAEPISVKLSRGIYRGESIMHYEHVPHPERIYHVYNRSGDVQHYILETPQQQRVPGANQHYISYNGQEKRSVYGVKIEKSDLVHCKMGISQIPSYGRGLLATVINDHEVLLEIERAMAIIARYKAVPKKLISVKNDDAGQATQALIDKMNNLGDDENPITNAETDVQDLSYAGKDVNFAPITDYLKRKHTVAIAPEFLIHGEDTNRATSKEQREAFLLQAKSIREPARKFIRGELKRALRAYPELNAPFTVNFGDFDVGEETETREFALKAYQMGLLKLGDAQEMLGLERDEELGDAYQFELMGQPGGMDDPQGADPFGFGGEAEGNRLRQGPADNQPQ